MENQILRQILTQITEMRGDITEMRNDIVEIRKDIVEMQKDIADLKDGQARLENEVVRINVILENDIRPSIQLLCEGHTTNVERFDRMDQRLDRIESKVDDLSSVQTVHDIQIRELTK